MEFEAIVGSDRAVWDIRTSAPGPAGRLPLTAEMLLERPSGDIFGLTQNAGMGWDPRWGGCVYDVDAIVDRMRDREVRS